MTKQLCSYCEFYLAKWWGVGAPWFTLYSCDYCKKDLQDSILEQTHIYPVATYREEK